MKKGSYKIELSTPRFPVEYTIALYSEIVILKLESSSS